jgi:hypothetical protein
VSITADDFVRSGSKCDALGANAQVFDLPVWHQQPVLEVEMPLALIRAIELPLHHLQVVGMNAREHQFHRWFHGLVVAQDPIGLFGPYVFPVACPPPEATSLAEPLGLG